MASMEVTEISLLRIDIYGMHVRLLPTYFLCHKWQILLLTNNCTSTQAFGIPKKPSENWQQLH
jgi:hypothetical protein